MRSFILCFLLICCFSIATTAQYKKIRSGVWEGTASYYHNKFNGRLTSNGEIFSNSKMTAASNFLKLGTKVRVTNLKNGRSVIVRINDRMNKSNGRLIDMSRIAAKKLGYIHDGLTKVRMEVVKGSKAVVSRYGKNDYIHSAKKRKAILNGKPVVVAKEQPAKRTILMKSKPVVLAKKESGKRTALLDKGQYARKKAIIKKKIVAKKKKVVAKNKVKKQNNKLVTRKIIVKKKKVNSSASPKNQFDIPQNIKKEKTVVSSSKRSRYWIEKKKSMKAQLPDSWLKTVSGYESDFKQEDKYLRGAINSFMDSTQKFTITLSDLKEDSTYRFIMLSRHLDELGTFRVVPNTSAETLSVFEKERIFENVRFSKDADSHIYFFEYKIPKGTTYVQMEWEGEKYIGASHEDFWLFIFDK